MLSFSLIVSTGGQSLNLSVKQNVLRSFALQYYLLQFQNKLTLLVALRTIAKFRTLLFKKRQKIKILSLEEGHLKMGTFGGSESNSVLGFEE